MIYVCKRCAYSTERKGDLLKHLRIKQECQTLYSTDTREMIIEELCTKAYNDKTYDCNRCGRKFNTRSSKCRHGKTCGIRLLTKEATELKKEVKDGVETLNKLNGEKSKLETENRSLRLELQYYKNKKNEKFYQLLLEEYLKGTHKKLKSGITDVTAEKVHAEIKEWSCWKEAIGQLITYNLEDPKEELHVYLFGKYKKNCKSIAVDVFRSQGMKVFEFFHDEEVVQVVDIVDDNKIVYTYTPSQKHEIT